MTRRANRRASACVFGYRYEAVGRFREMGVVLCLCNEGVGARYVVGSLLRYFDEGVLARRDVNRTVDGFLGQRVLGLVVGLLQR